MVHLRAKLSERTSQAIRLQCTQPTGYCSCQWTAYKLPDSAKLPAQTNLKAPLDWILKGLLNRWCLVWVSLWIVCPALQFICSVLTSKGQQLPYCSCVPFSTDTAQYLCENTHFTKNSCELWRNPIQHLHLHLSLMSKCDHSSLWLRS